MTDIEQLLRNSFTERAAHAPVVADLAGGTRATVRRQRRHRAQVGGVALAATATIVAGFQLASRDRPARPAIPGAPGPTAPPPSGVNLVPDGYSGRFRVTGTVLENQEHGPQLCGAVLDSLPPQCGGPDIVGWSWDGLEHESVSGTSWGEATMVGTWDGSRLTLTEPPRPPAPSDGGLPEPFGDLEPNPPCQEPAGGWMPLDPSRATDADLNVATQLASASPDYAGAMVKQLGLEEQDPTKTVLTVWYTGDLEAHEAELRAVWGGALCLVVAPRTEAELLQIQSQLASVPGMTNSAPDPRTGTVQVSVFVATESAQQELDRTHGPGVVVLHGWLDPMD